MNKPEVMEDLGVTRKWEACRKIEELLVCVRVCACEYYLLCCSADR